MKLSAPFIQLPLLFDAAALAAEIEALGEAAWMPHPQGFAGNSMLPLVAVDGDPANESFAGEMQPTPHLQRCPYLTASIAALGVVVGRTRLMRLSGQAEVKRHADQGYYWADRVRVHVPVVTQPTVRFECDGNVINMAAGECWIFDTWRQHSVENDAERARIHLVVDTVGGDRFWDLVGAGRNHAGQSLGQQWAPHNVAADAPAAPMLFETTNVPVVMTPWELTRRIGFLFGEAQPSPNLAAMEQVAARFCRGWTSLWAAYGERQNGWPVYRQALNGFMAQMQQLAGPLLLRNQLGFYSSLATLIGKVAVYGGSDATPQLARDLPGNRSTAKRDAQFERPVFIVSSPRSGSTLLFETLARAKDVHTIGGESHQLIEGIPELSPQHNGLGSNRLNAAHATPPVSAALRERFRAALRDRDGQPPRGEPLRMLEKTPKNSLRVPFLASVFPEAEFIFLHRDARETLGSMIDAWNSQRFRTYPNLPGWTGLSWSLLLVPDWQKLIGRPLAEFVATQWETAMRLLLSDLELLPRERVQVVTYDRFLADAEGETRRLCGAIGYTWDRPLDGPLPLSRYTLSAPDKDKWRRHEAALAPYLPRLQPLIARLEGFVAGSRAGELGDNG